MLARLVSSNLFLRFLAEGASRGTAFLLIPLLSWTLGAESFGRYSQIVAFAFAFVPLVSAGLGFTVIRRLAGQQAGRYSSKVLLRALLVVSVLAVCLFFVLYQLQEPVFRMVAIDGVEGLPVLVALLSWSAAIEALQQEYCRALGLVRRSVLFQFGGSAILFALVILLWALAAPKLETVLAILVLARVGIVVIGLATALRDQGVQTGSANQVIAIPVLAGLPFMISGLVEWGGNLGDRLIAGHVLDVIAVAQYSAAMMMLSLIIAIGAPVWWLLFPAIATAVNEDKRPESVVRHYSMIFAELAVPVFGLLVLIADPLLSVLINSPVHHMQLVMFLAGLAIMLNQLATGHEYYLVSVTGGKRLMAATLLWVGTGFILALLLAPDWGLVGIAAGGLIGKIGLATTITVMARQHGFSGMPFDGPRMLLLIIFGMAAGFGGSYVDATIYHQVGVFCAIYAGIWGVSFLIRRKIMW